MTRLKIDGRSGRRSSLAALKSLCLAACAWQSLKPAVARGGGEVFGFSVKGPKNYLAYDWGRLTSISWVANATVGKYAAGKGAVPSILADGYQEAVTGSPNNWDELKWIEAQVARARALGARGINFDLEAPLSRGASGPYARLVAATAARFHTALPGSQVSVDVAWSPFDVDGRNYDVQALADAADLLFIMAYDTQSQIWGRCVASANSPLPLVRRGLRQYLGLGLPPSKLVLGLPWYGYRYRCWNWTAADVAAWDGVCLLQPTSFRGADCSDAAGQQLAYSDIQALLHTKGARGGWDSVQQAPYFSYLDGSGALFQVWYDDPESLRRKAALAGAAGLRGVGVWNLDTLDYGPRARRQTAEMWAALDAAHSGHAE